MRKPSIIWIAQQRSPSVPTCHFSWRAPPNDPTQDQQAIRSGKSYERQSGRSGQAPWPRDPSLWRVEWEGGISAISKPKSLRTASCRVDRRTHPVPEHKAIHVWPNRIRQVFNDTDRTYFKKDRERALNDFPNSGLTPEQQKKITKKQIEFSSNHPRKKRA